MAQPPPTPPSSDIQGVNRDARAGASHKEGHPDPGGAIRDAQEESKAQPDHGEPSGGG